MDENELFFFYFDRNIFNYDRDYHDELKINDAEYVDGKFYIAPEDISLFNAWVETNPENIYNKEGFLNYCHQQWLQRQEIFGLKEVEIFGNLYTYRIKWKRTLNC